jgi:CRISP-associated protein Cas1
MLKRTLFFGNSYHLSAENGQLIAKNIASGEIKTIPSEDIGFVVFEHPNLTFTHGAIRILLQNNAAVIFCNEKFLPNGMLLNLDGNSLQTKRFKSQIESSASLKKKLWKQTVVAKIQNQAALLESLGFDAEALKYRAKKVRTADLNNEEARAAKLYWKRLFGREFIRDRFGDTINSRLNYGYAILRAAVARAISGSGLHPTIGIFHSNQYNSFCLADDLIEPYRPYVDILVYDSLEKFNEVELTVQLKAHLLGVLTIDTLMQGRKRPLMLALSETTNSLVEVMDGDKTSLKYPTFESNGKAQEIK